MRKVWLIFVLLASILLSACGQAPSNPSAAAPVANAQTARPTALPLATRDPNANEMFCKLVSADPTQSPDVQDSIFPPPSDTDFTLGSAKNPAMTIIEYSDFQCPYCSQLAPILEELQKKYPVDVKIIFRNYPLPSHQLSLPAAYAAEAAGLQDRFWEMHNILFSKQAEWSSMSTDQFNNWLVQQASSIEGLDKNKFATDMVSAAVTAKVKEEQKFAVEAKIPGTPFLLKNGEIYQERRDMDGLESVLLLDKLKDRQFTYCPPMQIDTSKQYIATLKTEKGDIQIQLFPDKAPLTVNSFVFLAREGWYNNVTFHRVLPSFIAQTGDPSGSGLGYAGYAFEDEITDLLYDKPGVVGMASFGPGLNSSQFFITYEAVPQLDGKYTVFGQVLQGMDVLLKLTPRDPSQQIGLPPGDKILSVEIQEK